MTLEVGIGCDGGIQAHVTCEVQKPSTASVWGYFWGYSRGHRARFAPRRVWRPRMYSTPAASTNLRQPLAALAASVGRPRHASGPRRLPDVALAKSGLISHLRATAGKPPFSRLNTAHSVFPAASPILPGGDQPVPMNWAPVDGIPWRSVLRLGRARDRSRRLPSSMTHRGASGQCSSPEGLVEPAPVHLTTGVQRDWITPTRPHRGDPRPAA